MKKRLLTMLLALVAIMMPIGANEPESVNIALSKSGIATFCYSSSSFVIPEGISASIITDVEQNPNGTVTVTEEDVTGIIPAGCAVILRGDEGSYTFEVTYDDEPSFASNLLLGSDEETTISEDGYLYFTLDNTKYNTSNSAYFKDWIYVGNDVNNQAHKASLALPVADYPKLAAMLKTLKNPHLQHTHGSCGICGQVTGIDAAWGASADDLTEGTLEDAIFNAGEEGSNIGYIKLLADVEYEIYVKGGNFTLDLNGHTISSESYTLYIQNNSNVTIVDNSETKSGKVISSGEGYFAVGITNSASVTIEEGTYESTHLYALNLEGNSSVTISGGSYNTAHRPVQIGEGCSATITGGTFTSTSSYAIYNDGTLDIEGGTFTSEEHYTLCTKGTLTIDGGAFSAGENFAVLEYSTSSATIDLSEYEQDITTISVKNTSGIAIVPGEETILLPEGYCFYKGEKNVTELANNESYTIGEAPTIEDDDAPTIEDAEAAWYESEDAEAPLGFGTLSEAVDAAGEEGSNIGYIKLLADVEEDIYVNAGTFTLDLNGHTISSGSHTLYIQNNSNVTIVDNSETKSGKVISSGEGSFAVGIYSASVTINGGTYESTLHYALNLEENSSATINGGSYVNSNLPVQIDEGCSATIKDGIFEYTRNGAIDNYGNLVVKGGTFTYKGEGEDVDFYNTIYYFGGSIDLSNYPTDAINSIGVINDSGEDITPGAETILLPEGYCFFDSEGTPVTVLEKNSSYCIGEEPAKYAVTFEANGGEGVMEGSDIYEGVDYTLPECTFTAPEGMMFKAWKIGEEEYQPYEPVSIEGETTITALWTAYVPQIIIKMHDSAGDGWHGDAIVVKKNGKEMGTATIEKGADGIVSFDYNETADYAFYWQYTEQDYRYPEECSFEIFIDDEEVFAAAIYEDVEATTSDCENYVDGELIHTIEAKEAVELESLTIVDGEQTEYINDASFTTVETLTYTRTLPNLMWNALYVPFEIPVSALIKNYDVAYVNDVHSFDINDDGKIDDLQMEIIKITSGTLKANYPYLIRAKNEDAKNMELILKDATLRATKEKTVTCSSVFMRFDVTGTYNSMPQEENEDILAISIDGSWKKLLEGTALKPFRLYLTLTALDGSPVKVEEEALTRMRIVIRGEEGNETGIDQITTSHDKQATTYFDLSGRRVKTPVKGGLYIVNGKKVVY